MEDIPHNINPKSTRLMDRFRLFIRTLHLAYATEKTYVHWLKRYIHFHNKKHPESMGVTEVREFLDHLTIVRNVSINTEKKRTPINWLIEVMGVLVFLSIEVMGVLVFLSIEVMGVLVFFRHEFMPG